MLKNNAEGSVDTGAKKIPFPMWKFRKSAANPIHLPFLLIWKLLLILFHIKQVLIRQTKLKIRNKLIIFTSELERPRKFKDKRINADGKIPWA